MYRRAGGDPLLHHATSSVRRHAAHRQDRDAVRRQVHDPDDRRLAARAAAYVVALVGVTVSVQSTQVGLVNLNRPGEHVARGAVRGGHRLANPVSEVPRGALLHIQVAAQLGAAATLRVSREQVDRQQPRPQPQLRGLHDRPHRHREVLAAPAAAIRHRPAARHRCDVGARAMGAFGAVGPAPLDEPRLRRFVVGEPLEETSERKAFTLRCHTYSMQQGCDSANRVNQPNNRRSGSITFRGG